MTQKPPRQTLSRKSSQTIVRIDSPDDAELYDTGDAADFAGTSNLQQWYNSVDQANDREEQNRLESGLAKSRRKNDAPRP